jgi:hypothetical protein
VDRRETPETDMKRIAFAALLATGLAAGAAHAQAPLADGGNVVGGGLGATIVGSGEDMVILYGSTGAGGGGAGLARSGPPAYFAGSLGEGPRVEYLASATASAGPGREAWVIGAGDDAQVVYGRPR